MQEFGEFRGSLDSFVEKRVEGGVKGCQLALEGFPFLLTDSRENASETGEGISCLIFRERGGFGVVAREEVVSTLFVAKRVRVFHFREVLFEVALNDRDVPFLVCELVRRLVRVGELLIDCVAGLVISLRDIGRLMTSTVTIVAHGVLVRPLVDGISEFTGCRRRVFVQIIEDINVRVAEDVVLVFLVVDPTPVAVLQIVARTNFL